MNSSLGSLEAKQNESFKITSGTFMKWSTYSGCLLSETSSHPLASTLFGFDTIQESREKEVVIPPIGTAYGFVCSGAVELVSETVRYRINANQWFCVPGGLTASLEDNTRVIFMIRQNYVGLFGMGGPVESKGRLRYIDGCSDTLLFGPHLLGDPCLNILYFPSEISQTPHTHPSTRMGIVIAGKGICDLENVSIHLETGDIFYIPEDLVHNFRTSDSPLTVVAYHPDSDWGPQHEDHPMINRTWVNGRKIDFENIH